MSFSDTELRLMEPVLGVFVLLIVLSVPVIAQIGLTVWMLRRRVAQSARLGPASWIDLQLRAFLLSGAIAALELASLCVLILVTKHNGYPLGYVGLFLEMVMLVYAGIAFLSAFLLAALFWYGQRNLESST